MKCLKHFFALQCTLKLLQFFFITFQLHLGSEHSNLILTVHKYDVLKYNEKIGQQKLNLQPRHNLTLQF